MFTLFSGMKTKLNKPNQNNTPIFEKTASTNCDVQHLITLESETIEKVDDVNESQVLVPLKPKKKVSFFQYNFVNLENNELDLYNPNLKLFELAMSQKYSMGNDSFTIDHGKDYCAFFKRLGDINYFIIQHIDQKNIIGSACAILQKYQLSCSLPAIKKELTFWYLCDLKIDKQHRGQNLTTKLFTQMFFKFVRKSHRGYLITMDPGSQQIIHIFNNMKKLFSSSISLTKLLIYTVSLSTMKEIERFFTCAFGDISYLSLQGTKDLILTSTNKPINLYHLQHKTKINSTSGTPPVSESENNKKINELPEDATIMFCFPKNSSLEIILNSYNIKTDITATIMSLAMNFFDWHDILTSNI